MAGSKGKRNQHPMFKLGGVDIPFLILLFVLLAYGLVVVFSASIPTSIAEHNGDASYLFRRQLMYAGIGIVLMFAFSQANMYYAKFLSKIAYGVGMLLLVAVLFIDDPQFPGFHRWIRFGGFSIQPSEIMKFCLILILAAVMDKYHSRIIGRGNSNGSIANALRQKTGVNFYVPESVYPILLCGSLIVVPAFLVMLGNHNSGMILLMLVGVSMLFIGDFKKGWFITAAVVIVVAVAAIFILYETNPELLQQIDSKGRIWAWLDKDYSPRDARWQINNSLYAIGSGGLFGVGLGNSTQKYYYVSEPQNDMIFAILCEELGFVGAAAMLALFAALIYRGVVIGLKAKDRFSSYLAIGTVMQLGIQVVMNVAVATDLIPNTGIGLPFFSYGGTSLIIFLVEMGVVLAISRESRMVKK